MTTINTVFKTSEQALDALIDLARIGVKEEQVSVIASDTFDGQDFQLKVKSKAAEGIAAGGTIGGIVGAIGAGLAGAGALALSGGAGVLVAGPLAAALAGAGAGGMRYRRRAMWCPDGRRGAGSGPDHCRQPGPDLSRIDDLPPR